MPLDVLLLGPIAFTDYSPPECMPFGGRQQMAVHKLIGGQRVIDTLGPDDEDIQWSGRFFGAGALSTCLALDSLRAAGQVLPLSYAGMAYTIVIQVFARIFAVCLYGLNTKSAVLFRRTGRMGYWAPLCLASSSL